jgi:malonyl-CoA O-methyltransferase
MTNINKNSVAKRFGRASSSYEDVTPVQEQMAQSLITKITENLKGKNPASILELGCGTGRLTKKLRQQFPQAKITAIDIAPEMISHAEKTCADVNYITADAEKHIYLLEEKFDLIVSSATIQWFEDPEVTLQKARNLLKDGGLMALATFAEKTFHELATSFKEAYEEIGCDPKIHHVPMKRSEFWQEILPESEVENELLVKNFKDVRDFLISVKTAGANNSSGGQVVMSKSVFRKMSQIYQGKFSDSEGGGVVATYHLCYVLFCWDPVVRPLNLL